MYTLYRIFLLKAIDFHEKIEHVFVNFELAALQVSNHNPIQSVEILQNGNIPQTRFLEQRRNSISLGFPDFYGADTAGAEAGDPVFSNSPVKKKTVFPAVQSGGGLFLYLQLEMG